jgi:predicted metalloprotease
MSIMRFTPLLAISTLLWILLAGTAHAAATYPIHDSVLTANKLYRSGKLKPSRCPERNIKPDDIPAAKRYMTSVLNCLNTSWAAQFKRMGLPFSKAEISFAIKPRRYCGFPWGLAAAMYCDTEKRFLVQLNDDLLDDPSSVYLFFLAAHEYGHHVQNLSGLGAALAAYRYKGKSELNEQFRRNELQGDCLAGAFMGSVWNSLDRPKADWVELLETLRRSGDEAYKAHDHGKGRNQAAWLDKGFRAASPAACNTWAAGPSTVS